MNEIIVPAVSAHYITEGDRLAGLVYQTSWAQTRHTRAPGLFLTTRITANLNLLMAASNKGLYPRREGKKPGGMKYPIVSRKAGILVAMALELPGSIIGGLFIGYLLDNYFNTSPWIMMALTALGFTAACIRLVRWVRYFSEKRSETESADREQSAE